MELEQTIDTPGGGGKERSADADLRHFAFFVVASRNGCLQGLGHMGECRAAALKSWVKSWVNTRQLPGSLLLLEKMGAGEVVLQNIKTNRPWPGS